MDEKNGREESHKTLFTLLTIKDDKKVTSQKSKAAENERSERGQEMDQHATLRNLLSLTGGNVNVKTDKPSPVLPKIDSLGSKEQGKCNVGSTNLLSNMGASNLLAAMLAKAQSDTTRAISPSTGKDSPQAKKEDAESSSVNNKSVRKNPPKKRGTKKSDQNYKAKHTKVKKQTKKNGKETDYRLRKRPVKPLYTMDDILEHYLEMDESEDYSPSKQEIQDVEDSEDAPAVPFSKCQIVIDNPETSNSTPYMDPHGRFVSQLSTHMASPLYSDTGSSHHSNDFNPLILDVKGSHGDEETGSHSPDWSPKTSMQDVINSVVSKSLGDLEETGGSLDNSALAEALKDNTQLKSVSQESLPMYPKPEYIKCYKCHSEVKFSQALAHQCQGKEDNSLKSVTPTKAKGLLKKHLTKRKIDAPKSPKMSPPSTNVCIICGQLLYRMYGSVKYYNIFAGKVESKLRLANRISEVLNQVLTPETACSKLICESCVKRLEEIEHLRMVEKLFCSDYEKHKALLEAQVTDVYTEKSKESERGHDLDMPTQTLRKRMMYENEEIDSGREERCDRKETPKVERNTTDKDKLIGSIYFENNGNKTDSDSVKRYRDQKILNEKSPELASLLTLQKDDKKAGAKGKPDKGPSSKDREDNNKPSRIKEILNQGPAHKREEEKTNKSKGNADQELPQKGARKRKARIPENINQSQNTVDKGYDTEGKELDESILEEYKQFLKWPWNEEEGQGNDLDNNHHAGSVTSEDAHNDQDAETAEKNVKSTTTEKTEKETEKESSGIKNLSYTLNQMKKRKKKSTGGTSKKLKVNEEKEKKKEAVEEEFDLSKVKMEKVNPEDLSMLENFQSLDGALPQMENLGNVRIENSKGMPVIKFGPESDTDQPGLYIFEEKGMKKYICTLCHVNFCNLYGAECHIKCHKNNEKSVLTCYLCPKNWNHWRLMKAHLVSDHQIPKQYFYQHRCKEENCGKLFHSEQTLYQHTTLEHTTKTQTESIKSEHYLDVNGFFDFSCNLCSNVFMTEEAYELHLSCHVPEGVQFQCSLCGFTHPAQPASWRFMKGHFQKHHKEYINKYMFHSLNCNRSFICKSHFPNSDVLDIHEKCHVDGTDAFRCFICRYVSTAEMTSWNDMKLHLLRVHFDVLFSKGAKCVCGKAFKTYKDLEGHLKVMIAATTAVSEEENEAK